MKKTENKLSTGMPKVRIRPEVKVLIRQNGTLMRAIAEDWDKSGTTIYNWIAQDKGKILHERTIDMIALYLNLEKAQIIETL